MKTLNKSEKIAELKSLIKAIQDGSYKLPEGNIRRQQLKTFRKELRILQDDRKRKN